MRLAVAVCIAGLLEVAIGELPTRYHPVAWFGRAISPLDREWRYSRTVGTAAVLVCPAFASFAVGSGVSAAASISPLAGIVAAGTALFLSSSLRRLLVTARSVVADTAADIEHAREGLLALAGRDATDLSPGQLRSAAVESAAENLADGLVAPLAAFVVAATLATTIGVPPLPAAAGAGAWVKGVNTMDSMLGYRAKPVGTPAARLDDIVMWLPARASGLLLATVAVQPLSLVRTRRWLGTVPSPNSGWPMGAVAAALDVRLEKPGAYVLNPDAAMPDRTDADRGIRTVGVAGVAVYLLAVLWLLAVEVTVW